MEVRADRRQSLFLRRRRNGSARVSVRRDERKTAANKGNRCQPNSGIQRDHTAKSRFPHYFLKVIKQWHLIASLNG